VTLLEHPRSEALAVDAASLIHQAANPYYDWFFGGREPARAAIERGLRSPASELSAARVTVLVEEEDVLAGLFVALGGADLAVARKSDALAALASAPEAGRRDLIARMGEARELFDPVGAGEYYLSKIAVSERLRGRGVGRRLLTAYLDAGRRAGFRRFRLDVAADNTAAIALYRATGFAIRSNRERAGMRYAALVLEEPPADG
jgi:ribosomal protein S18 acetylase RimI-like enzyme